MKTLLATTLTAATLLFGVSAFAGSSVTNLFQNTAQSPMASCPTGEHSQCYAGAFGHPICFCEK